MSETSESYQAGDEQRERWPRLTSEYRGYIERTATAAIGGVVAVQHISRLLDEIDALADDLKNAHGDIEAGLVMLAEQQEAARSIMWMAEQYAEGGGSQGPEMADYLAAKETLDAVPDQCGREILAAGNAMADVCRSHAAAWGGLVDGNSLRSAVKRWIAAMHTGYGADDE